jgi:hypothetical protein
MKSALFTWYSAPAIAENGSMYTRPVRTSTKAKLWQGLPQPHVTTT